jgi:hypothetical protein
MRISSFSGSAAGAASTPMAVHDLMDDWTFKLFLDRLTPNKNAVILLQDSLDGFVADVRTLRTIPVAAVTNLTPYEIQPSRRYEIPNSRFGVAGATARVFVQQIDAGATIAGRFVVDF